MGKTSQDTRGLILFPASNSKPAAPFIDTDNDIFLIFSGAENWNEIFLPDFFLMADPIYVVLAWGGSEYSSDDFDLIIMDGYGEIVDKSTYSQSLFPQFPMEVCGFRPFSGSQYFVIVHTYNDPEGLYWKLNPETFRAL